MTRRRRGRLRIHSIRADQVNAADGSVDISVRGRRRPPWRAAAQICSYNSAQIFIYVEDVMNNSTTISVVTSHYTHDLKTKTAAVAIHPRVHSPGRPSL